MRWCVHFSRQRAARNVYTKHIQFERVVRRVLCAKVVGATSSKDFLVTNSPNRIICLFSGQASTRRQFAFTTYRHLIGRFQGHTSTRQTRRWPGVV